LISSFIGVITATAFYISFAFSRLPLRFRDRESAANVLAAVLKNRKLKSRHEGFIAYKEADVLVLGICRGGVVIADIVSRRLAARFGVINGIKIGHPTDRNKAIGALMEDGTRYLDKKLIRQLEISEEYIQKETQLVSRELENRGKRYESVNLGMSNLQDSIVILVDDGASTCSTIIAAARSIRLKGPRHLTIALPVAPKEKLALLRSEADSIEVIITPSFGSFGFLNIPEFYEYYSPVCDRQIIQTIRSRVY
jgi:putative phosphoribosyl transferase